MVQTQWDRMEPRSGSGRKRKETLLSIRDLSIINKTRAGNLSVVDKMSVDIYKGEILGLVGESGCGHSALARAITRIIDPPDMARVEEGIIQTVGKAIMGMINPSREIISGQMLFRGLDLLALTKRELQDVRGRAIRITSEDSAASLNPAQSIKEQIAEAIRVHQPEVGQTEATLLGDETIERLRIGPDVLDGYPYELSSGMRQRVMIALALALKADIIIADESTASLDVLGEDEFLELLIELTDEFGLTILLVAHHIDLIAQLADRAAVMYAGRLVEVSDIESLIHDPKHPYTESLLRGVPNTDLDMQDLNHMEGLPLNLVDLPRGCRFHPRCPEAMEICSKQQPWLVRVDDIAEGDAQVGGYDKHLAACWLHQEYEGKRVRRY